MEFQKICINACGGDFVSWPQEYHNFEHQSLLWDTLQKNWHFGMENHFHKLCYEIPDTPSYGIFVSTYTRAVF